MPHLLRDTSQFHDTLHPTLSSSLLIEGPSLSTGGGAPRDITQEIEAFSFTENEEETDELELCVSNRNLQFVDDPLFQEGDEIAARFGYVGNLSPGKKADIKDIDYDFLLRGAPTNDLVQNPFAIAAPKPAPPG